MNSPASLLHLSGAWLDRVRPLWVGPLLLVIAWFEGRFLLPALALLALLWAWAGLGSGVWLRATPLNIPWLIWIIMIPVALWATAVPEMTRVALSLFIAQAIAFWTIATWLRSEGRARWAWAGLVLIALALAVLSLFWLQWDNRLFAVPAALQGIQQWALPIQESVNKNVMAGILVGLWPLALAALASRRPGRILGAIAAVAVLAILVLSQSRGALLAAGVSLFVLVALRWPLAWLAAPLAMLAIALLAWQGRALPLLLAAVQSEALGDAAGRLEVWSRALYAVQDFAFTGIGMGTYPRVIPLLYPYFLFGPDVNIPHAHNLWLQVAVDLGLPGLIAFLAMLLVTAVLAWRSLAALAQAGEPDLVWLQRGAIASLAGVLAHGVVDAVPWNTRPAWLVWAVWGLAVGLAVWALEQQPCPAPGAVLE
jgi:putative inorganic carbon (HCO3(-)) transporter